MAQEAPRDAAQPNYQALGPDSLTWRLFGDWRGVLIALWAGSMQNMHPQLGAAVERHSRFFEERWQRLFRSLYPIGGVVYDGDRAERTGRQVRDYHRGISGVDSKGRRYNALDPATYFWAHSTFLMSIVVMCQYLGTPLTEPEKQQLYTEGVRWYAMYGMPMRDVPPNWASFQRYWDHMCAEVLEDNKATRDVLDLRRLDKPPLVRWLPDPLWSPLRIPLARGFRWLTIGMYPDSVRQRLGLSWSPWDERRLRLFGMVLRTIWRLVPPARRYHPRARAAWHRASGQLPADAPLVETPARNLPPPEYRDSPHHYLGQH